MHRQVQLGLGILDHPLDPRAGALWLDGRKGRGVDGGTGA